MYPFPPAWFASTRHVPAAVNVTTAPYSVQPVLVLSSVNVTGLPEPPPVAVTVYVAPPAVAGDGGVEVKVIACAVDDDDVTVIDCCA